MKNEGSGDQLANPRLPQGDRRETARRPQGDRRETAGRVRVGWSTLERKTYPRKVPPGTKFYI